MAAGKVEVKKPRAVRSSTAGTKSTVTKKKNNTLIKEATKRGYTFLGQKWSDCDGPLQINRSLMYDIQNMNTEAQSAKDLIATMIGKKGIRFITRKDKVTLDKKWEDIILDTFTDPTAGTFQITKDKFYTHHFASGEINAYIARMQDGSARVQILDSRYIERKYDSVGNLESVKYMNKFLKLSSYVYMITKYNTENPYQGKSSYETVVFDALSDSEASKRNFYFFRNNAMPNLIITMEDDITNPLEVDAAIKKFEENYKGTENSNKLLASGGIKEVKTIDFTNKDLDLLDLKKFSIKQFGMVFRIDPRFLGYRDGENGSHSEYDKMASQSDQSMVSYAEHLEVFMLKVMKLLYPGTFPFSYISVQNERFIDDDAKLNMYVKLIQNGIMTPVQAMEELELDISNVPEFMNQYFMNMQYNTVENIMAKTEADIKAIGEKSKQSAKEDKEKDEETPTKKKTTKK